MRVEYQKESSYHVFVQGKRRKRHVEAQSAEEKEKKKRVYTDTHSRKNLCSLLHCHPLKSTFHKERKKKSTSEEEKATKSSLPPIMVVLYCFFDSTPQAISETLSWFELVLSKKKK